MDNDYSGWLAAARSGSSRPSYPLLGGDVGDLGKLLPMNPDKKKSWSPGETLPFLLQLSPFTPVLISPERPSQYLAPSLSTLQFRISAASFSISCASSHIVWAATNRQK
jgi:hypothetical protein